MPCVCENVSNEGLNTPDFSLVLQAFAKVRESCRALSGIFVPDSEWESFRRFVESEYVEGLHKPAVILALKRGYLRKLTSPVHRFLISNDEISVRLTSQYRSDLIERWMYSEDVIKRHHRSKMFAGKLTELQCAKWLEVNQHWQITSLEALGGSADIEGIPHASTTNWVIEMKYIGTEDQDFVTLLEAFRDGHAVSSVSPYTACDFLLSRVYEAAIQVENRVEPKLVILAISSDTMGRFDMQLRNNWINWDSPSFFKHLDFREHFDKLRERYPRIEEDLAERIHSLDKVWILVRWNDPARPALEMFGEARWDNAAPTG